jgi:uncharacterized protein YuzE
MRFKYFQDTNSLFIKFNENKSTDSIEIADGVVADLDENDNIVGIESYSIKDKINLNNIIFEQLPLININFINDPIIEKVA